MLMSFCWQNIGLDVKNCCGIIDRQHTTTMERDDARSPRLEKTERKAVLFAWQNPAWALSTAENPVNPSAIATAAASFFPLFHSSSLFFHGLHALLLRDATPIPFPPLIQPDPANAPRPSYQRTQSRTTHTSTSLFASSCPFSFSSPSRQRSERTRGKNSPLFDQELWRRTERCSLFQQGIC